MDRCRESLDDAGLRLDEVLLIAEQQLQTSRSGSHLAPTTAFSETESFSDFFRDSAGSQRPSSARRPSPSGITEHDGAGLGQPDDRAPHIDSSTNLLSAPNLGPPSTLAAPANGYTFLAAPDNMLVPALASGSIGLGDEISDTMEPLPSSYMDGALDKELMLSPFADFPFQDIGESFGNDAYTPFEVQ